MSYPPAEHRQQPDNGDRPTTARPPSSAGADYYYEHHDPQYTYSEEPLDEDDESEDEDVFAYLPRRPRRSRSSIRTSTISSSLLLRSTQRRTDPRR